MSKILILTASPMRDKPIDELLAEKLRAMGNEVHVRPCLREGRDAVLQLQPDICIVPPIRNLYSRDFVEQLKRWGVAVVTRHTEPSCDWDDFKRMDNKDKQAIVGAFPYLVDAELVWGQDEMQILARRGLPFPIYGVGSFSADIYKNADILKQCTPREVLFAEHKLDLAKRTILILCAWGFIDSAPDLQIDDIEPCTKDKEGRDLWLAMIDAVQKHFGEKHNILITLHPNIDSKPYREFLEPRKLPLDTTHRAIELVNACDVVIHAGSTVAIGAHFLNKPCFQYGDQNRKEINWWNLPKSIISQVSPYAPSINELLDMITTCENKSNASPEAIIKLEQGRYGLMDGQATARSAEIINKIKGQFRYCWPEPDKDYNQLFIIRNPQRAFTPQICGVCKHQFWIASAEWLGWLANYVGKTTAELKPKYDSCCPWCASKMFMDSAWGKL